jgi:hypothetical protein
LEPTVSSFNLEVDTDALTGEELRKALSNYLNKVTSALKEAGCPLIGHIKLMFDAAQGGCLIASATSFHETPSVEGDFEGISRKGRLTVHAVVYGTAGERLEEILKSSLRGTI